MAEAEQTQNAGTEVDLKQLDPGKFFVVKPDCIACDACAQEFPDLFKMIMYQGERKAEELPGITKQAAEMDLWKVIKTCPTGAIKFDGGLPPEPEEEISLEIVEGWEDKWFAARRSRRFMDTVAERDRRYGLDREFLEFDNRMVARIHFPTIVPDIDLKYKYGMPDEMPDYDYEVELVEPTRLRVKAWVSDPIIKNLCYKVNGFPEHFEVYFDLPQPAQALKDRYTEYKLQVALFTEKETAQNYTWPSHYITTECTGCMICLHKCPTSAITGDRDRRHFINEDLCINCRACGTYCPFHAIEDDKAVVVPYVKPKEVAKATVIDELCTGCSFCVDVCPTDCISLVPEAEGIPGSPVHIVARVDERRCISCKICEHVCIKDAIIIERDVPFQNNIGWSFQYPENEESRIIGAFSDQVTADAPLTLAERYQKSEEKEEAS